jgi:hypothetical protein
METLEIGIFKQIKWHIFKTKQIVKSEIKLDLPLIVPDFVYIFHMIWLNAIYFIGWKPEKYAFFFRTVA